MTEAVYIDDILIDLELFESEAWTDLYKDIPESIQKRLGLELLPAFGVNASIAPAADIIAFNRIIAPGIKEPLSRGQLDELSLSLALRNVKRFFIQLFPGCLNSAAEDLLTLNSYYYYNDWVKLIRGTGQADNYVTPFTVRHAETDDAELFARVFSVSFDFPDIIGSWIASTIERAGWSHYLLYYGNDPAGSAMMYVKEEAAWLGFAGVLPKYRGMGGQQLLLSERINDAAAKYAEHLVIETAVDKNSKPSYSYRNAVKAGFTPVYRRRNYLFQPAGV